MAAILSSRRLAVAAFTGARRNEILALRWTDLNPFEKTLRIERALEETKLGGRTVKEPKTPRGRRTIEIDNGLLSLLLAERDKHLHLVAGELCAALRAGPWVQVGSKSPAFDLRSSRAHPAKSLKIGGRGVFLGPLI